MRVAGPWVKGPRVAASYSESLTAMGVQARMQPISFQIRDRLNAEVDIGVDGREITAGLAGFIAGVLMNVAAHMPKESRAPFLQQTCGLIVDCVENGVTQEGWGQ